jgi:uncharacterized protein (TIGR02246 family)
MFFTKVTFIKILTKKEKKQMKTIMNKIITIKSMPVLTLVLMVVLVSSFVKSTAQDPLPGPVYSADNTMTDIIAGNLHATISIYSVEADIAAIKDIQSQYCVAMETGDLELWLSTHADDMVKMGPDAPATYGKEELRASTKPLFDNFIIEMDFNCEEIQVNGDWAFARGTFTATMTPKAGGEPLYMDAKTISILKRQADGSWKFTRNCFNSNVPPAPPTQQ